MNKQQFWPGTNVPKSTGNAFSIRPPSMFDTPSHRASVVAKTNGAKGVRSGFGKDTPAAKAMKPETLPTGVYFDKRTGNFSAHITRGSDHRYLGVFASPESAYSARLEAEREMGPSRRGAAILAKPKNQVVIEPKGGSVRRDQIKRGGI